MLNIMKSGFAGKKILMSLMLISVLSSLAVSATRAYFTGEAVIPEETFSTGTIILDITADDTYQNGVRTAVPVHFDNLKPGDTMRQWITLHNSGTLPIDYLTVDKQSVSDAGSLLTQIVVSAMGKIVGGPEDYAYFTDDWMTLGPKPVIDTWFSPSDMLDVSFYRTPAGKILPGEDYSVLMDFSVPTTVGNAYQGLTASFDMVFVAEQEH